MILPFSKQINDKPTYFAEKIMVCLLSKTNVNSQDLIKYANSFDYNFEIEKQIVLRKINMKIHTIRVDSKNRWYEGRLIHPVYNNRTKQQFQFAPTFECKGTQKIQIFRSDNNMLIYIDDKLIDNWATIDKLVQNDGFLDRTEFMNYFKNDFEGKIIHFTDFRY